MGSIVKAVGSELWEHASTTPRDNMPFLKSACTLQKSVRGPVLGGKSLSTTAAAAVSPWLYQESYRWFLPIQSRLSDNDQYGHMNNAIYATISDTVAGKWGSLQRIPWGFGKEDPFLCFKANQNITFHGSARFPEMYMAGFGLSKLGKKSIIFQTALFQKKKKAGPVLVDLEVGHEAGDPVLHSFEERGLVTAENIQVFVDSATLKSTDIPDWLRPVFQSLEMRPPLLQAERQRIISI